MEVISMTAQETRRFYVIQQVLDKKIRQAKASELLDLSLRHIRRLIKRVRASGASGMVHRLRGESFQS